MEQIDAILFSEQVWLSGWHTLILRCSRVILCNAQDEIQLLDDSVSR